MAKHAFLSDDWFTEVERLVDTHGGNAVIEGDIVINLTVTDTPFGDERRLHIQADNESTRWAFDHADDADVTLVTDYETAREMFVSGNPQAGLQAFMAGKMRVQGDMAKLLSAQSPDTADGVTALQAAIQGVTA